MTIETLLKSDLTREFERTAKSSKRDPADVLAELMAEYIERETDGMIDEIAESEGRKSGLTEDNIVAVVKAARLARQQS